MEGVPADLSVTDTFAQRFRARAGADSALSFADFMDLALYDPEVGYYMAVRNRVGRDPGADFITSSSFDRVFGPLVAGAAQTLIAPETPADYAFAEIGAEPRCGILDGDNHPFASASVIRVNEAITIPDRTVVFSNELFDAQPFHRVVFREGRWRELAVTFDNARFVWTERPTFSPEVEAISGNLPATTTDGYTIDLPMRARRLLETIVGQSWNGLFIAFDYGRTWRELTTNYPEGTGRSYRRHQQSDDLLANPGTQDLTCHVCWDWLEDTLKNAGFRSVVRSSQESFFLHHAPTVIEAMMASDPDPLSPVRSQLKQLLHPALMGQRFEVLSGLRL